MNLTSTEITNALLDLDRDLADARNRLDYFQSLVDEVQFEIGQLSAAHAVFTRKMQTAVAEEALKAPAEVATDASELGDDEFPISYPAKGTWRQKIEFVLGNVLECFATSEQIADAVELYEPGFRRESVAETVSRISDDDILLAKVQFNVSGKKVVTVGLRAWAEATPEGYKIQKSRFPNVEPPRSSRIDDDDLPF